MGIAAEIDRDVRRWSEEIKTETAKIARAVQTDMLAKIPAETPVGRGDHGGHMRDGWVKGTIQLKDSGGTLYGVRNKLKPFMVHLVNFPHRIVVHGVDTGRYTEGNDFVDRVQDWGVNELDRRLRDYLGESE